jgi:NTP pyrophosphatase (non-canonical NTP hydrolase)
LLLINSELGEATEGLRQGDYRNFKEELADSVIRLFDLAGYLKINLEYEIERKMEINKNRAKLHNKKF